MKPDERQAKILEILRRSGYVSVEGLSQSMDVSQMTIRRDLAELHRMNLVTRHHGGATLAPERGDTEWPLQLRSREHLHQKKRIGQVAASFIQDGDVVILDSGSTTLQVAHHLVQNRLTVVSNFQPILAHLIDSPNVSLISTGGVLFADNQCFLGSFAVETIHQINANVAVMATSCLSLTKGMTNRNISESEVKRAMIEAAEKVILVMDSSKMHQHTLASVGPLQNVDTLITDAGLSMEDRQAIQAEGVQVVIADEPPLKSGD